MTMATPSSNTASERPSKRFRPLASFVDHLKIAARTSSIDSTHPALETTASFAGRSERSADLLGKGLKESPIAFPLSCDILRRDDDTDYGDLDEFSSDEEEEALSDEDEPLINLLNKKMSKEQQKENEKPFENQINVIDIENSNDHNSCPSESPEEYLAANERPIEIDGESMPVRQGKNIEEGAFEPQVDLDGEPLVNHDELNPLSAKENEDLSLQGQLELLGARIEGDGMLCFVCGANLAHIKSGLKGRLNHIKRCSKTHGVQAKDVRHNDDQEMFVRQDISCTKVKSSSINPYTSRPDNSWHGDAVVDLTIAGHASDEVAGENAMGCAVGNASSRPSLNDALMHGARMAAKPKPPPSLNSVLLAGARRIAKAAKIRAAGLVPGGAVARNNNRRRWNRVDYSKRACPSYKKIPGTDFGELIGVPRSLEMFVSIIAQKSHIVLLFRCLKYYTIQCATDSFTLARHKLETTF